AVVRREGKDLTLATYGRMVYTSLEAADELAKRGVETEVIDLRTLRPLDMGTVVESVKKTGRAVVVEETWRTGGFAGEIAGAIQERAFDYLDGPVARVGGVDIPSPFAHNLEQAVIPDADRVVRVIEETFGL
ncbi:MAG: transketolase C-terminal domain-containing protein, partial [SAR202 cluster bacterium]|nr:transketolase C-terminal domain-containing protein [SAR202 cluster bacterium]